MSTPPLKLNSLVLYKQKPSRVLQIGNKKIKIEVYGESTISVRPKDVLLLHPGPLDNLATLIPLTGEVDTAWELLAGGETTLEELAELAYGDFSAVSAWAAWQIVMDGLLFAGTPAEINARSADEVAAERLAREAKAAEEEAWSGFLERISRKAPAPEDDLYLQAVVDLALNRYPKSQVLRALGHAETPENAHALLLDIGYWDVRRNPYPARAGLPEEPPNAILGPLADEPRRDLTHLTALAIDDEGTLDPDDALSWENGRIWVHIADAAALIPPDCPADTEARARAANLYLPEGTVTMLPLQATQLLALGLNEISPALSFGMEVNEQGEITQLEIVPSQVRVTRLTYAEAECRLEQSPLKELLAVARRFEARRAAQGAINIDLPEVKVQVRDELVEIRPLPQLNSRNLVRDAMLMTGEAVAQYAIEQQIALPFTSQEAPTGELPQGDTPAAMFALRRTMRPSRQTTVPGDHAGLGMSLYVQATSPLRRYLDLVVHQQLRAFLNGEPPRDEQAITELIGATAEIGRDVRRVERLSNNHWRCVYLLQNPEWRGEGMVVEKHGRRHVVLLPELGTDTSVYLRREFSLDDPIEVQIRDVDLVNLQTNFEEYAG